MFYQSCEVTLSSLWPGQITQIVSEFEFQNVRKLLIKLEAGMSHFLKSMEMTFYPRGHSDERLKVLLKHLSKHPGNLT